MCLLIVVVRPGDDVPLLVGANRDERFERPASPMVVHRGSSPRILGGRDEVAGGTWLAVNELGVVAALTNRPSPGGPDPSKRSRGELPLALASHASATEAVEAFCSSFRPGEHNPCWLVAGDRYGAFTIDMTDADVPLVSALPAGVHIVENRPPGAPSAKVDNVRRLLGDDLTPGHVAAVLADHSIPDGPTAPAEAGLEVPPEVGAACVHTERYGTRWSGLITVGREAAPPSFRYADGPPCTTPFTDASPLW